MLARTTLKAGVFSGIEWMHATVNAVAGIRAITVPASYSEPLNRRLCVACVNKAVEFIAKRDATFKRSSDRAHVR